MAGVASIPNQVSANGIYLIANDGTKIALKRSVLRAIKEMMSERHTGKVILNFKNGGLANVTSEHVFIEE